MVEQNLPILPVTQNDIVIGVLKRKDVVRVLFESYNMKNKQSKDLQKQLEFKEDYLSIVSRDIQTPLTCYYSVLRLSSFTERSIV